MICFQKSMKLYFEIYIKTKNFNIQQKTFNILIHSYIINKMFLNPHSQKKKKKKTGKSSKTLVKQIYNFQYRSNRTRMPFLHSW